MFDPPVERSEPRRILIPIPAAFCILAVLMVLTIVWLVSP